MFNPNQVTRPHLFGNPREQSAALAKVARYGVLREQMTTLVSAIYSHDETFVFSRLIALFHTFQRSPYAEFINGQQYRMVSVETSPPPGVPVCLTPLQSARNELVVHAQAIPT
jgi:hypothetical protein